MMLVKVAGGVGFG